MKNMILFLVSLLLGLLLGKLGTHLIRFEAVKAGVGERQVDKITGEKNSVLVKQAAIPTSIKPNNFSGPYSDRKQSPIPIVNKYPKIPQPYGYGK